MHLFTKKDVEEYSKDDMILSLLQEKGSSPYINCTTSKWLFESIQKRMIYWYTYKDLLITASDKKVLDVGSGLSPITTLLFDNCDYTFLETYDHDQGLAKAQTHFSDFSMDWYDYKPKNFDVIIANDLFPNVDQRLYAFLKKYLKHCKEMRLVLTYYPDSNKFYRVKRLDANELLTVCMWNREQVYRALWDCCYLTDMKQFDVQDTSNKSIFPNGRLVSYVTLEGGLSE